MKANMAFVAGVGATPLRLQNVQTATSVAVRAPVRMGLRLPRVSIRFPKFGGFGRFGGFGGIGMGGSGGGLGSGGPGRGPPRRSGGAGAGGGKGGGNVFTGMWDAYNRSLESKPILTKALTSFVGFFLGDLLAQKFLGDGDAGLDMARLARMASFGFLFHGPTGHYFYGFLDRLIAGKSVLNVASKVGIDQVLWAPIFTAAFFVYLGVAEGKTLDQIVDKVKKDTIVGVTTSWKFWPLAHAINFAFIPTQQRLLYINTLQVGYNVILSIIGNR